eukprot:5799669-Alexandrium_andersonii.AAC.1
MCIRDRRQGGLHRPFLPLPAQLLFQLLLRLHLQLVCQCGGGCRHGRIGGRDAALRSCGFGPPPS